MGKRCPSSNYTTSRSANVTPMRPGILTTPCFYCMALAATPIPFSTRSSPTFSSEINSADDFINPPELGIAQKLVSRMPHAKFILIPISNETHGHGTHTVAAVWKDYLIAFLAETEKK